MFFYLFYTEDRLGSIHICRWRYIESHYLLCDLFSGSGSTNHACIFVYGCYHCHSEMGESLSIFSSFIFNGIWFFVSTQLLKVMYSWCSNKIILSCDIHKRKSKQLRKHFFFFFFLFDQVVLPVLQIVSNGIYNSIEHRAVANSVTERISIAMFFNTKFSAEIGPAIGLINPQNPPLFKRVGMEKYFRDFFARKLEGKAYLEYMKIKNGEGDTAWWQQLYGYNKKCKQYIMVWQLLSHYIWK